MRILFPSKKLGSCILRYPARVERASRRKECSLSARKEPCFESKRSEAGAWGLIYRAGRIWRYARIATNTTRHCDRIEQKRAEKKRKEKKRKGSRRRDIGCSRLILNLLPQLSGPCANIWRSAETARDPLEYGLLVARINESLAATALRDPILLALLQLTMTTRILALFGSTDFQRTFVSRVFFFSILCFLYLFVFSTLREFARKFQWQLFCLRSFAGYAR